MKYFTSDQHFGHDNVLSFSNRDFPNIHDHDKSLMDSINNTVGPTDTLYILGDFAWSSPGKYKMQIECKNVYLIIGNHDKREASKNVFGSYHDILETKIGEEKVILCHYPMCYWPSSHHGAYHLYGHMHGQREYTMNNLMPSRRSMDVGVDEAFRILGEYRPFSEEEILTFLYPRAGHDPVSFYRSK